MVRSIKQIARKSKTAIIVYKIFQNWLARRRLEAGNRYSTLGSTHSRLSLEESLRYINDQFDDYLSYGGLTEPSISGKKVLEIGFGDNVGVALKLLAAGAAKVTCLDKFYSAADSIQQQRIYLALRETLPLAARRPFDEAISFLDGMRINPKRLERVYGVGVEQLTDIVKPESVDLIISRAVLQDVFDPAGAFVEMERALAPGGFMLHKIDLSDQGMFRDIGMHPLTFLTIPEPVYRLMAADSGNSNRKTISYYQAQLSHVGLDSRIVITSLLGSDHHNGRSPEPKATDDTARNEQEMARSLVREIRPRLAPEFWGLSDEELMVDGIFVVARKPDRATSSSVGRPRPRPVAARSPLRVEPNDLTNDEGFQGQFQWGQ